MEAVNEGSYRISGRFGEAFLIPTDGSAPIKLIEATAVEFTVEIGQTDVPIPGRNTTGTKDGPETYTGTMTVQKIDSRFESLVFPFLHMNLDERRRQRDLGQRPARTLTLQTWLDDPDALGAEGWQMEGLRLSRLTGGYNIADELTNREHPFRFERLRKVQTFERIGNQFDAATGLPAIVYTARVR